MTDGAARSARPGPSLGRALWGTAGVSAAIVAIAVFRQASLGNAELVATDDAVLHADWRAAVAHARAAAEAFVPGASWVTRACERLQWIGRRAESRGDVDTALLAYGALRSAALATRTPFASGPTGWRTAAEDGLLRVAVTAPPAESARVSVDAMRADLLESQPPGPLRLALLAASFAAVLGGTLRFMALGEESPALQRVRALTWIGAAACAVVLLLD